MTHWLNVICIALLLMSGMQIFNAHPRLYWGVAGSDQDPAIFELGAEQDAQGELVGVARLGSLLVHTTGWLGVSPGVDGEPTVRGFPSWATVPSWRDLAAGRRWHFLLAWLLVANGLVYTAHGFFSGHFRRDLGLKGSEVAPRHVISDIWSHIRLKSPRGEAARRYNVLQKLAYLGLLLGVLPLAILTGLTMSPGMDAGAPWLVALFGGRQSARTLHFIGASLIVFFILVHLFQVLVAGPWNEIRSMLTGWYDIGEEAGHGPG